MKHPKLPLACDRYGSSMGRRDTALETEAAIKFHLYRMKIVDHDYDEGGAYWGMSPNSGAMWHAYGEGPEFVNEVFVRGWNREDAKQEVRKKFPQARFFR